MDGRNPESVIDRPIVRRRYRVAFAFCGIGGGALGFKRAVARLARLGLEAGFDLVGGIECDASTARDFERLTGAPCLVAKVEELTAARLGWYCDATGSGELRPWRAALWALDADRERAGRAAA